MVLRVDLERDMIERLVQDKRTFQYFGKEKKKGSTEYAGEMRVHATCVSLFPPPRPQSVFQ